MRIQSDQTARLVQMPRRRRTGTALVALAFCLVTLFAGTVTTATATTATATTATSTAAVASTATWVSNGAGSYHNCGVRDDASLWCWGEGYAGRLGNGDSDSRNHPVRVGKDDAWTSVVSGSDHTCAIRKNHHLWCWGGDQYGQLGVGRRDFASLVPVRVFSGPYRGWTSVSLGDRYTCGVDLFHRFWCWGHDQDSVLGDGENQSQTTPELIGNKKEWAQVSANASGLHTCALKLDGTLWCWGLNKDGQLGMGSTKRVFVPTQVGKDTDWTSVSVGGPMTCATKTDGTLWCWGSHQAGELGTGDREDQLSPRKVGSATNWSSVSVGHLHACAVRFDSSLWCWGYNLDGEVGDGTTVNRSVPEQIGASSGWDGPSLGWQHSCARQTDLTLWCWGDNRNGQLGNRQFGGQSLIPTEVE